MSRLTLVIALLLALAAPASAAAAKRGATLALMECATSAAQAERAAVFEGRIHGRHPGQRLQMRFVLQSRAPGERRWTRVDAPGWGEWVQADPGVGRYVYEKRVENLAAPASYRAVARFRWSNALGKVVRSARVASAVCRQPDLRADLRPEAVRRTGERYLVDLRNAGRSPAGVFEVVLTVNGRSQSPQTVLGLAAGDSLTVAFQGPPCLPGSLVFVAVDPQAQVEERDELDNSTSVPCPEA